MATTLPAAPAVGFDPRYGGIPQVPSPTSTAAEAISGDIGNLGALYNLAGPVNQFNQQQAALGLQTNLPGYQGMIGQSSQNIGSLLQGQIPQDVANQIAQQAAERGTAIGSVGSPNANTALLRAMGLTSLGLQQQGEQELTTAIGRTPQAPIFDPSKFFVTPEQQQAAQAAANLYGSAPIPSQAAAAARQFGGVGSAAQPGGYRIVGGGQGTPDLTMPVSPGVVSAGGTGLGAAPPGQTMNINDYNKWIASISKPYGGPGTTTFGGYGAATPDDTAFMEELLGGGGGLTYNDPYQSHAPLGYGYDWSDYGTQSAPQDWSDYGTVGSTFQPGDFEAAYGDV